MKVLRVGVGYCSSSAFILQSYIVALSIICVWRWIDIKVLFSGSAYTKDSSIAEWSAHWYYINAHLAYPDQSLSGMVCDPTTARFFRSIQQWLSIHLYLCLTATWTVEMLC